MVQDMSQSSGGARRATYRNTRDDPNSQTHYRNSYTDTYMFARAQIHCIRTFLHIHELIVYTHFCA